MAHLKDDSLNSLGSMLAGAASGGEERNEYCRTYQQICYEATVWNSLLYLLHIPHIPIVAIFYIPLLFDMLDIFCWLRSCCSIARIAVRCCEDSVRI